MKRTKLSQNVPALSIPGKPSYKTLREVVNEYLANENAVMQLAMQKSASMREEELKGCQNLKPDGARWTITRDPIELTDGYRLHYEFEHNDCENSFLYHIVKECKIEKHGYMTLIPIIVDGNPNKILVFFEDTLIQQLKLAPKISLSILLQLNVTMDIRHSKIKTDVVKNEVIWEFYGGKVAGRIEQGYYVFYELRQFNMSPLSEFVEYLNKFQGIKP